MFKFIRSITFAFAAILTLTGSLPAQVIVLNDDFSSGFSYSIFNFTNADVPPPNDNPDDVSFADFSIETTGGNPGGVLQLTHLHEAEMGGNGDTFVQSFLDNTSVAYNPAAQGAFNSITFSFDYLTSSPNFNSVFVTVNDNNGGQAAEFLAPIADGNWQSYTATLDQSDFSNRDFSGNLDLNFGFGFVSDAQVDGGPESFDVFVDNFQVSVSAVPEPTSLVILGFAGLTVIGRRGRS